MALVFAEGFDDFLNDVDISLTAASATAGKCHVAGGRGGTGQSVFTQVAGILTWNLPTSPTTATVGFSQNPNFGNCVVALVSLGTIVASFQQFASEPGVCRFFDATNLNVQNDLNSKTLGLLVAANYSGFNSYIEMQVTPGNPGTITVRIDGVQVYHSTAANLSAAASISQIYMGDIGGGGVGYLDDLYVCDSTGGVNNDFLGDTKVLSVAPTGDGAESAWTPSSGTTHFNLVAEAPIDYGATGVSAPSAPLTDTYTFPALTGVGIVRAVQVRHYCTTTTGGVDKLNGITRIAGTDYPGAADQFVPVVYRALDTIFQVNPATAAAWTNTSVSAAEFGAKRTV